MNKKKRIDTTKLQTLLNKEERLTKELAALKLAKQKELNNCVGGIVTHKGYPHKVLTRNQKAYLYCLVSKDAQKLI